ncbi:MAG: cation transporter [Bacteroidetes bacterium]|nr:cation transporter [Bacteroidota bacterium]
MKVIISVMFLFFAMTVFGQKGTEEIKIKTTAECNSCKERIEGKLNYTKGIRFAELDVPTKVLTVSYSPSKISLKEIKELVAGIGYDADEVKAEKKAYNALPECCKVGGM